MKVMEDCGHIEKAIQAGELPDWVERVEVRPMEDWTGEPSLSVTVVIRRGRYEIVEDGEELETAVRTVHAAVRKLGEERWPFTDFVSADELEAA